MYLISTLLFHVIHGHDLVKVKTDKIDQHVHPKHVNTYDFIVVLSYFDFHPRRGIVVTKGKAAANFVCSLFKHAGYIGMIDVPKAEVHTNVDGITYIYADIVPKVSQEEAIRYLTKGWDMVHNPSHMAHPQELEAPIRDFFNVHFKNMLRRKKDSMRKTSMMV